MDHIFKFQLWPGSNEFFCGGRVIIGPKGSVATLMLSIILIIVPSILFIIFVSGQWINVLTAGILVLDISSLATLASVTLTEPGILPRAPEPRGKSMPTILAVMMNGKPMNMRYCATCHIYRPPKCAHCSICDNCIENFDHHCAWVGTCVGKRNYRYFLSFVVSIFALCVYVVVVTFLYLWDSVHHQWLKGDTRGWLDIALDRPVASIILLLTVVFMISIGALLCFHCYLLAIGKTTREQLKGLGRNEGNWCSNFAMHFCTEEQESRIKALRLYEEVEVTVGSDWYSVMDVESGGGCVMTANTASLQLDKRNQGLTAPLLASNTWNFSESQPSSPRGATCCGSIRKDEDAIPMLSASSTEGGNTYGSMSNKNSGGGVTPLQPAASEY